MKKYIKKLLSYSVYRRTLLAYSVSILIITILILICTYKVFTNNLKSYSTRTSQQLLNQLVSGVENLKTDVNNVMSVIANESSALRFYQDKKDDKRDNYYLFLRLTDIKNSYSYIEDIAAMNFNTSVCIRALGSSGDSGEDMAFVSSMIAEKKYIIPRTISILEKSKNVVSFLQYLPYYNAAVVIDVNADWFQYSINKEGKEGRSVYIIDTDGNAVTGNTKVFLHDHALSEYFYDITTLQEEKTASFFYDDKKERNMLFFSKSEEYGWWFIDVQDYSYFNKSFQDISIPFIAISAFFILVCLVISILFNRRIKKPLIQLVNKCKGEADREGLYNMDELRYLDIAIARGKQAGYVYQNHIKVQFLRCLLLGQQMPSMILREDIKALEEKYKAEYYCVMLLKIQNLKSQEKEEEEFKLYRYTIGNLADEIFEKSFCCKSVDLGNDLVGMLFMLDKKEISEEYVLCFKQLKQFAEEMIFITVSGSMGLIVESQSDIFISCQKAKQYMEMNQLIAREDFIDSNNQIKVNYHEKNEKLVEAILEYTAANCCNGDLSLKSVSQVFGLSVTYVGKIFKSIRGESYSNYVTNYRLEKTKITLVETTKTIQEIASEYGFANAAYYATVFKNTYGMTPTAFRSKASQ